MRSSGQQRLIRREVLTLLAAALAAAPSGARAAEQASAWAASSHSAIRLIDGGAMDGAAAEGGLLAAVSIRLKPGFKTYWRHPGDSGVPPLLRFEGSRNLRSAEVRFPAPHRFDDGAGGVSFGYSGEEVILPVAVVPIDRSKPVLLKLQADYAVCEKLCVPASGTAELALHGRPTAHGAAARAALAASPRRTALGADGPLRIIALSKGGEEGRFRVSIAAPEGADAALYVEAPQPWFFEVGAIKAGIAEVRTVAQDPAGPPPELTLTLVAGTLAVEAHATLDRSLLAP